MLEKSESSKNWKKDRTDMPEEPDDIMYQLLFIN